MKYEQVYLIISCIVIVWIKISVQLISYCKKTVGEVLRLIIVLLLSITFYSTRLIKVQMVGDEQVKIVYSVRHKN